MSWVAVAIGGGALIGGGASIAGGLLSKPEDADMLLPPSFNSQANPLLGMNMLDLLASQGMVPSLEVLAGSGPIQQAINAFKSQFPQGGRRRDLANNQAILDSFMRGEETPGGAAIARAAGYGSVAEVFAAQQEFETQLGPRIETLKQIAARSNQRQFDVETQLGQIAKQPLDLTALRDMEMKRISRQLDDRSTEALRAASVGGFNPGRQLEGIENLRSDSELDALSRAVGYLAGQGQAINNLNALNPANRAQQFGPNVIGQGTPTQLGGPQFVPQNVNPFGAAVAQAGQQVGGAASSLGLLQMYQNMNKPGVSQSTIDGTWST